MGARPPALGVMEDLDVLDGTPRWAAGPARALGTVPSCRDGDVCADGSRAYTEHMLITAVTLARHRRRRPCHVVKGVKGSPTFRPFP